MDGEWKNYATRNWWLPTLNTYVKFWWQPTDDYIRYYLR
jgi:hypothetical protein